MLLFLAVTVVPTFGAESVPRTFAIPAGEAADTLKIFAVQAQSEIMFPSEPVAGVMTNPVKGMFAPRDAIERLIANTGLIIVEDPKTGALMITRPAATVAQISKPSSNPASLSEKHPPVVKRKNPLAIIGSFFALALAPSVKAADAGMIEGHVLEVASGNLLNNARVSIEGTSIETLTNGFGEYRLTPAPTGPVVVQVSVAGFARKTATAVVSAGSTTTLNFDLNLERSGKSDPNSPVVLDSFVVAAQREMSGSSVAINERRAAANLRNVVAADEFGDSTEGNVGEFVKYIPGVALDYTSAEARFISLRGMPSFGTAVTINGNRMASAAASFSRATEFDQVSLNNMSRIEVIKSPLPDSPADTIGGAVNMVLKSAFEQAKPSFTYRADLNANFNRAQDENFVSLRKSPGPRAEATVKVKPGFDFNYINPVSKNFGFTISVMTANQFTPEELLSSSWKPVTTASSLTPPDKPFLGTVGVSDNPKEVYRWSFGTSLDYRLGAHDMLSLAGQWNHFDTTVINNRMNYDANGSQTVLPASFGPTFMESASGAGSASHSVVYQHKIGTGYNLSLTHRHTGSTWDGESGGAYSSSISTFHGLDDGVVRAITASLSKVTLRYDDIHNSIPGAISTSTTTGVPVDYRQLANYTLQSVTTAPSVQKSVTSSAFANVARNFGGNLPLRMKTGLDVRREDRDFRNPTDTWTFIGPDHVAGTADDRMGLYDTVFTDYYSVNQPFGLGKIERPSNAKLYNLLVAHPDYFSKNDSTSWSSAATQSRKLTETVAAGYVRGDLGLFQNRLRLAGGVRYEQTYDDGYGLLNDVSATYQKDAHGNILLNAAGQPEKIAVDALSLTKLQYQDRGAHAKRNYGDFYPSLNSSYQLSEKLLIRASYAHTITRPQLTNIVPSATATDPTVIGKIPTITVSNTALKPWSSQSYDVTLEYYFDKPGIISLGVFRKDISNFFGSVQIPSTPELLAQYGFDNSYSNYQIVTTDNIGDARVSGVEFDYRQTLTFLPAWASGVSVFANATSLHLEGASQADFSGFIRQTMNWGVSLSRPRYTMKLNWNYRGRQRLSAVTGVNVPAGSYNYQDPRLYLDVNFEWRVMKHVSLFANVRNLTDIAWNSFRFEVQPMKEPKEVE